MNNAFSDGTFNFADYNPANPANTKEFLNTIANLATIGAAWNKDSSLEKWFPISAEKIKQLEADLDATNAKLFNLKGRAVCLYCQKEFDYKTGEGQAALADHICTCDMNPLIKGCNQILAQADELYRLVEAYLCTPNTEPIIEDHYKALVAWFVRNKRPDGSEPRPVSPEQEHFL